MVINGEFSRLTSGNTKFLARSAKVYMYLDTHAHQRCLPTAAVSSSGLLKLATWFLTQEASEQKNGLDCLTPAWGDLPEASLTHLPNHALQSVVKLSVCYCIHLEISAWVRSSLASQAFSLNRMYRQSLWVFGRVEGPRHSHRHQCELKAWSTRTSTMVGKSNFPQTLNNTTSIYTRSYLSIHSSYNWKRPVSSTCPNLLQVLVAFFRAMYVHCNDMEMVP